MSDPDRPPPKSDFAQRLKAARDRRSRTTKRERKRPISDFGPAIRIGVDLVSGIAVGVFIGWLLDRWLETTPWLMLVFFVLGSAAGLTNVMRTARKIEDDRIAAKREPPPADE